MAPRSNGTRVEVLDTIHWFVLHTFFNLTIHLIVGNIPSALSFPYDYQAIVKDKEDLTTRPPPKKEAQKQATRKPKVRETMISQSRYKAQHRKTPLGLHRPISSSRIS